MDIGGHGKGVKMPEFCGRLLWTAPRAKAARVSTFHLLLFDVTRLRLIMFVYIWFVIEKKSHTPLKIKSPSRDSLLVACKKRSRLLSECESHTFKWRWSLYVDNPFLTSSGGKYNTLCYCYLGGEFKKTKGSPYSITERRVPELIPVLGSQPAGDVNHKRDGKLPLLSASYPRNP